MAGYHVSLLDMMDDAREKQLCVGDLRNEEQVEPCACDALSLSNCRHALCHAKKRLRFSTIPVPFRRRMSDLSYLPKEMSLLLFSSILILSPLVSLSFPEKFLFAVNARLSPPRLHRGLLDRWAGVLRSPTRRLCGYLGRLC